MTRLKLLTRDGRSQAQVIEEALERMPRPEPAQEEDLDTWMARLEEITTKIAAQPRRYRDIKEFDAHEYDERGLPR